MKSKITKNEIQYAEQSNREVKSQSRDEKSKSQGQMADQNGKAHSTE